jgi:hypothetical protein
VLGSITGMAGTVVMIIVLVLFPVAVLMSGAAGAALIGTVLKRDRDQAHEGTEHLAISERDPYQR